MTNEDIKHNFLLCIKWLKDSVDKIGNEVLYIGWGEEVYGHHWLNEFRGYDHNIKLCKKKYDEDLDVSISATGGYYVVIFGFEKDDIEKWEKSYEGTGMRCPKNHNTFEDLSIISMERFLKQWKRIKGEVLKRIKEMDELNDFEV